MGVRVNWIEYVHVLKAFRARFGQMPSSMLTDDGALRHMQAALDSSSADERAAGAEPRRAAQDGGQRRSRPPFQS